MVVALIGFSQIGILLTSLSWAAVFILLYCAVTIPVLLSLSILELHPPYFLLLLTYPRLVLPLACAFLHLFTINTLLAILH